MNRYDDLLQDTIDLHCHVDLEFSETLFRKRGPEDEWLPAAERSGMRGVVLKSHLWPTVSASEGTSLTVGINNRLYLMSYASYLAKSNHMKHVYSPKSGYLQASSETFSHCCPIKPVRAVSNNTKDRTKNHRK